MTSIRDRLAPTKAIPPVPPYFVRHFVQGGWRQVERVYGCRTSLMMTWIEMSGGLIQLQSLRREHLRELHERARLAARPSMGFAA